MASEKLIVVFGATGTQGGSVADTFLKRGWQVRAVTRNPTSTKAKSLVSRGAEVVKADLDDPSTLPQALQDAHVVFVVTDFWGLYNDPANRDKPKPNQAMNVWAHEQEIQQVRNVFDATAKLSSLERLVVSSLSHASKWSKGKYTKVYHFDSKALAVEYLKQTYPELWAKTSLYQAGYFLSNFMASPITKPIRKEDGSFQFFTGLDPTAKLPIIAAEEDSGPLVLSLVEETPGKNLIGYREWLTMNELTEAFTKATGIAATQVPKGEFFHALPPDLREELEQNWIYSSEFGYEGRDDPTVIHPHQLDSPPHLDSVVDYFRKQDWSKI